MLIPPPPLLSAYRVKTLKIGFGDFVAQNLEILLYCFNLRLFFALEFVKPEDILKGFTEVFLPFIQQLIEEDEDVAESEDEINAINSYLEDTWIGKTYSSGLLKRPRFKYELWNKHSAVLRGLCITNNMSEQFNGKSGYIFDF